MLVALELVSAILVVGCLAWVGEAIGKNVDKALGEPRMRDRQWGADQ